MQSPQIPRKPHLHMPRTRRPSNLLLVTFHRTIALMPTSPISRRYQARSMAHPHLLLRRYRRRRGGQGLSNYTIQPIPMRSLKAQRRRSSREILCLDRSGRRAEKKKKKKKKKNKNLRKKKKKKK